MTEINLQSLKLRDKFPPSCLSKGYKGIFRNILEQRYGGARRSHKAAMVIQHAYRQFRQKQKLSLSAIYETRPSHYRYNSLPNNFHYIKNYNGHMLLDSCKFKVGDPLSTKCDEDLENFKNDSRKTDSTEDSDSSTDNVSSCVQDSGSVCELPPPMSVISTDILSTKSDKPTTKMKLFLFDKLSVNADYPKCDHGSNALRPDSSPSVVAASVSIGRSPRDSGVSSHSSNADLLMLEYSGTLQDSYRGNGASCFNSQRAQSFSNSGITNRLLMVNQSSTQNDVIETSIPPINEDNCSLLDSSTPLIASIMTSSKDSGVDADSSCSLSKQVSSNLRRLSFQEKPIYWKMLLRQGCQSGCMSFPINASVGIQSSQGLNIASPEHLSPWSDRCISELEGASNPDIRELEYKELIKRVLFRVAVNLFNRNTAIGLQFMEDHQICNVRCPIEIANFLRSREVNQQVLTDFLSSQNSIFHIQVLRCFLQNMPLENLSFLEAFHMFINSFKLPFDSSRITFLTAQFCQYYTHCIQKSDGVEMGALMSLGTIIILLQSSVVRSRLTSSNNSILSFSDFVGNVHHCFKGQRVPFNMEMLQKIYLSISRVNIYNANLAENLVNRIGNIDECKSKSSSTTRTVKTKMGGGYLQEPYRRLTYCCDVQQADILGRKLKKNEHLRSIFVFNDTIIVAKRLSRTSTKQSRLFRTDSRFQCKVIINLLGYSVVKESSQAAPYQIKISPCVELTSPDISSANISYCFTCDSESSRDKLLSKINMSQLETQCIEQLSTQQWQCLHNNEGADCMCVSIIRSRLPNKESFKQGDQ